MYFSSRMCCSCLQQKQNLQDINLEILNKLLFCTGQTDEFVSYFSNHTNICTECSDRLDLAFNFKKMCVRNALQYKKFINDLRSNDVTNSIVKLNEFNQSVVDLKEYDTKLESNIQQNGNFTEVLEVKQEKEQQFQVCLQKEPSNNMCVELFANSAESRSQCNITDDTDKKILEDFNFPHFKNSLSNDRLCNENPTNENSLDLNTEFLSYSNGEPHSCNICGKSFKYKNHLITHFWNHNQEKSLYSCQTCGKSFSRHGNLKTHMLLHTNQNCHICKICEKSFSTKGNLKIHFLTHTNERPYPCTFCPKNFTTKGNLKMHMLIHTNERPHQCLTCGKCFTTKCNLKSHMLIHSNERPYVCNVCGKYFNRKCNMESHMLTHTNGQT